MTNVEQFFRETLARVNDPIAAIKAARESFGLSLIEAKELWVRTQGYESLSAAQQTLVEPLNQVLRENDS